MKCFIVTISIFVSVVANACDCIGLTVSQVYFHSDLTFIGELVGKQDLCDLSERKNDPSCKSFGPIVWRVKPVEIYRDTEYQIFRSGDTYENVYIYQSGGMCSANFEIGKKYLIFSKSASNGMNSTNQCMGTKKLELSTETIKELNSLKLLVNKNP
jgi:hypothetical protein